MAGEIYIVNVEIGNVLPEPMIVTSQPGQSVVGFLKDACPKLM
jgi:hypothetical protein